jgi:NADH-quinone oxidoreductase subunit E
MTPKMVEVAQNPLIKLHTYSELEEISGYVGNFKAKIKKKARSVDMEKCTGCGDCWTNCLVRNRPEIPEVPSILPMMDKEMLVKLDEILDAYKGQIGIEIPVLEDINEEFNYLPKHALIYVAERLQTPVSRLYEIATFFNAFSLVPRGKYTVSVCLGTACHVQGAGRILEKLERDLGIKAGETTEDRSFSLETVRCVGCCGLAPVVTIEDDLYGKVAQAKLSKILKKYGKG